MNGCGSLRRLIAAGSCILALCGASPWDAKAPAAGWEVNGPSDPNVVRAAQDWYANVFPSPDFTNVTVIEHGALAMLEAMNGDVAIEALLRKDSRGWHVAIPGKDVVPADFIDMAYHPPKAVTRALVSSNCRSLRSFHQMDGARSVILRSFYAVAPARDFVAAAAPGGPRRFHVTSERYRVCIE
jgi:hypothetical protein